VAQFPLAEVAQFELALKIISCSHFMKIIVALQFGCGWIRKIIAEFVNFFLNAQQLPFREKLKTF